MSVPLTKGRRLRRDRRKPVILERENIATFIEAQKSTTTRKGINPVTFSMITGLCFTTGLRVGEVIGLTSKDFNADHQTIYIPSGKGSYDRTIEISDSVKDQIIGYQKWAKNYHRDSRRILIFDSENLKKPYQSYSENFRTVARDLGLRSLEKGRRRSNFTTHDLRHIFTVNSLFKIYENAVNVREAIIELSSHLGHKSPQETYWYVEAVPKLTMAALNRQL